MTHPSGVLHYSMAAAVNHQNNRSGRHSAPNRDPEHCLDESSPAPSVHCADTHVSDLSILYWAQRAIQQPGERALPDTGVTVLSVSVAYHGIISGTCSMWWHDCALLYECGGVGLPGADVRMTVLTQLCQSLGCLFSVGVALPGQMCRAGSADAALLLILGLCECG